MSVEQQIERFCAQLRRRQVSGSNQAAKRTAEVLRLVVTSQKHASASALINDVHQVGLRLQAAKPNGMYGRCSASLCAPPIMYHLPQSWQWATWCAVSCTSSGKRHKQRVWNANWRSRTPVKLTSTRSRGCSHVRSSKHFHSEIFH